jgi:hypothetical protein
VSKLSAASKQVLTFETLSQYFVSKLREDLQLKSDKSKFSKFLFIFYSAHKDYQ